MHTKFSRATLGKYPRGRLKRKLEDNIKMHHREVSCGEKVNGATSVFCSGVKPSGSTIIVLVYSCSSFSLCRREFCFSITELSDMC